jgi:hypothetical protein
MLGKSTRVEDIGTAVSGRFSDDRWRPGNLLSGRPLSPNEIICRLLPEQKIAEVVGGRP